jgi:hypothetical protein
LGGSGSFFGGDGVSMDAGYLLNSGSLTGGSGADQGGLGIYLNGGSITNTGTVSGGSSTIDGGVGVEVKKGYLKNSGSLIGSYGGVIGGAGASIGTSLSYDVTTHTQITLAGTVLNDRLILGGSGKDDGGAGVGLLGGSLFNNGTIVGGAGSLQTGSGVSMYAGYLLNSGKISGGNTGGLGISLTLGVLINDGTVQGGVNAEGGTVTNAGLIEGSQYAVTFQSGSYASRLIVDHGAAFSGAVDGSGTTLELAAGTSNVHGTLNMGGSFSGFNSISFDSGTSWEVIGDSAELAGGETITGFDSADTLGLTGFTATSHTYVSGVGLKVSNGSVTETLDITGAFSTGSFVVLDETYGSEILLCYLRGTRILTPVGEIPIESLKIGDAVITRFNGYRKIKWIGRQSYFGHSVKNKHDHIPVRITAGALEAALPKRDLWISPGHSMLIAENLILARNLINGVTIRQDQVPDEIHYYQLEFDTHDCVLAEGCWSESFADYADFRTEFDNFSEFHMLYPDHKTPEDHKMCAPRPELGTALAAALSPIVARASSGVIPGQMRGYIDQVSAGLVTGWAQDMSHPELPVRLGIFLHDEAIGSILACDYREDLQAAKIGPGRCSFRFESRAITRGALGSVKVRRASDASELPRAPHCRVAIAAPRPQSRAA